MQSDHDDSSAAAARERLRQKFKSTGQERRRRIEEAIGKPITEMTWEDVKLLVPLGLADAEKVEFLEAMRAPFVGIPQEELRRELESALAEVRAEMRAERMANIKS
jgi:hypothetical protein